MSGSYLVEGCTMPFCKGCGHTHVIRKLSDALEQLHLPPENVCLVTDIGCIGLADGLFADIHTVHTTHGRSTAFATGIELADGILGDSKLKTIVLIGDGGAMIGLLHLVNAALLNTDVTVLLCNNFLFGMTGGQHSSFSPLGFHTPTAPGGTIVPPLDLCRVLADAQAGYVARTTATDKHLAETIAAAIAHPGFSVVEILELCTEHATSRNELTGAKLEELARSAHQELGVLRHDLERKDFGAAYTSSCGGAVEPVAYLECRGGHDLRSQVGLVVAGSAGERVQSAAGILCEAAAISGLFVAQKNDNPVTQGSGFSVAEVSLSPTIIDYLGIEHPDAAIVVSQEGLDEAVARGTIAGLGPKSRLILDASLQAPETAAEVVRLPLRSLCGGAKAALAGVAYWISATGACDAALLDSLIRAKSKDAASPFPEEFYRMLRQQSGAWRREPGDRRTSTGQAARGVGKRVSLPR